MDSEDAKACLRRHATSKIKDAEDIEGIGTLGFRGEAIPSIAAVSRFSLKTRTKEDDTATAIKITGGKIDSINESLSEPGTIIEVSDLFFNTPARKKFLKSDAAEYNAVANIFNTLALGCADVSFSLTRNNIEVASYPACDNLLDRIKQLNSAEFAENLRPIEVDKPDFKLSGYIGTPENTRVNRTGQKIFINKRPVLSASINNALSRAYDEFLPHKRFPVAVLFLEIEPSFVDVNVHPAKREVRIRTEHFFADILVKTIKKELCEKGLFSEREVRPVSMSFPDNRYKNSNSGQVSFNRLKETAANWNEPSAAPLSFEKGRTSDSLPKDTSTQFVNREIIEPEKKVFKVTKILGQALGTYILVETESGLGLFDQHAAHERILYEEITDSFDRKKPHSQKMIFPETLHLNIQENAVMEQHLDAFTQIGFGINDLGGATYSIDALPAFIPEGDAIQAMKDTLHELMAESKPKSWESGKQTLAAILACKTYSVKAGKILDIMEMEHLIQKLAARENPHTCPHGRPTFYLLTKDQIEKKFKRR
jgi:DNA mismatch repair protein MutL